MCLKNPKDNYSFGNYNYIAIEGNIGAGKTNLTSKIANDFNAKLILERFADNPFLAKFYKAPERYAFTLEMSFLAERYQQISDDLSQRDLFKDFMISDYDVYKSLVFSKITLPEDEFDFLCYDENYGAIKATCTRNKLVLEFYSIDQPEEPVDRIVIEK